jgi:hypothetical protein
VIVPAIGDKYQSMKCNMTNKIKSIYMSMRILFEYATQNLLMQHSHNKIIATVYISTGDIRRLVEPYPLSEGFSRYAACNMEHYVFEFLLNYIRRVRSDLNWSKLLKKNPERPFLLFITPSDIAYKDEFLDLCHKWEQWEPQDKSWKNPITIRTNWREDEVEQNAMREEDAVDEWWEGENMGYTEETDDEPELYWNDEVRSGTGSDD